MKRIPTPRISDILKKDFKINKQDVVKNTNLSMKTINDILNNTQQITPSISAQLGKYFNVSKGYLVRIQNGINHRNRNLARG